MHPSGDPTAEVHPRSERTWAARDVAAAVSDAPGTVTEFLEALTGERVDAAVIAQGVLGASPDNRFALAAGADLVRRSVLLEGRETGLAYIYAETVLAPSRLPVAVVRRLETSRDPIGRVLVDHGVRMRRQPIVGPSPWPGDERAPRPKDAVCFRLYRIIVADEAAIEVAEWFLRPVAEALVAPRR